MLSLLAGARPVWAQGTAFTYQGQLQNNGSPANGSYDLAFTLYATNAAGTAIAGPVTNSATPVTNGLFTTLVNFGPGVFTGTSNWLQIAVSTNGANSFTTLTPRQQVTPTPYAIYSANAGTATTASSVLAADVTGTLGLGQLPTAVLTNNGAFSGNGSGLTNLFAWQLAGNTGTTNGNYLGTTDNQSLEIRVGGVRAGYISPSNGLPNIVFGPAQNSISNTTAGASILGGTGNTIGTNSSYSVIGGGYKNIIQFGDGYSFLGAGYENEIASSAGDSVLVGGDGNEIESSALYSVLVGGYGNANEGAVCGALVGGYDNVIQASANYSFLGGGYDNVIQASANYSVLVGGQENGIQTNTGYCFLGGGVGNTIQQYSSYCVLGGGINNTISSSWSFLGSGSHNTVSGGSVNNAALVSGNNNSIQGAADEAFLGCGAFNLIQGEYSYYTVLGGGYNNIIQGFGYGAVLGGGYQNSISNNAEYSFLGGGQGNFVGGYWATVGGGYQNIATNIFATVPGGSNNVAGGVASFAAGANAQAPNPGAFVWSDLEGSPFTSTNANSFNVRANGGVRLVTSGAGLTVDGLPVLAGTISLAQLPAGVVTNYAPSVTLGSLSLGSLNFAAYPATLNLAGHSLLYADTKGNFFCRPKCR